MDRYGLALALYFALSLTAWSAQPAPLEVTFLDVGEGEAIVLISGDTAALIDAGNLASGHKIQSFLSKRGIATLDHVILTHPHLDHIGGIFHLVQALTLEQRYDNGETLDLRQDIFRWYTDMFRQDNYRPLSAGDKLTVGDALLQVIHPHRPAQGTRNQQSLVMRITHGGVTLLLMADVDKEIEQRLLARGDNLRANLLKVGHHGAADATSRQLLQAVNPDYAVISINRHNVRGYPSQQVLRRVQRSGARLVTTYELGDLVFTSDGRELSFKGPPQ
jgi:competence protein ComEC